MPTSVFIPNQQRAAGTNEVEHTHQENTTASAASVVGTTVSSSITATPQPPSSVSPLQAPATAAVNVANHNVDINSAHHASAQSVLAPRHPSVSSSSVVGEVKSHRRGSSWGTRSNSSLGSLTIPEGASKLISLASNTNAEPESPRVKFQPRPLPPPGSHGSVGATSDSTGAASSSSRPLLTREQNPARRSYNAKTEAPSPPNLLASLNSAFAYQHTSFNHSPNNPPTLSSKPPSPAPEGVANAPGPVEAQPAPKPHSSPLPPVHRKPSQSHLQLQAPQLQASDSNIHADKSTQHPTQGRTHVRYNSEQLTIPISSNTNLPTTSESNNASGSSVPPFSFSSDSQSGPSALRPSNGSDTTIVQPSASPGITQRRSPAQATRVAQLVHTHDLMRSSPRSELRGVLASKPHHHKPHKYVRRKMRPDNKEGPHGGTDADDDDTSDDNVNPDDGVARVKTPRHKTVLTPTESPPPVRRRVPTKIQLRYLFFIFTILQVGICCGITWYLGYRTAIDSGHQLANQCRAAVARHVIGDIQTYMRDTVNAADQLARATSLATPSLVTLGGIDADSRKAFSLLNSTNVAADLSYQLIAYPSIPSVGVSTVGHQHISISRGISPRMHYYFLSDPAVNSRITGSDVSPNNTLYTFAFDRAGYYNNHSQHIDPYNNPASRTRASYFQPVSDFSPADDVLTMLGPVVRSYPNFVNTDRVWFKAAIASGESRLQWSPPVHLITGDDIGLMAMKPVYDTLDALPPYAGGTGMPPPGPGTSPPPGPPPGIPPNHRASGNLSYVAFALASFNFIHTHILSRLSTELGDDGCIYIIERNGLLVATNGPQIETDPRVQMLDIQDDSFIRHMMNALRDEGFLQQTQSMDALEEELAAETLGLQKSDIFNTTAGPAGGDYIFNAGDVVEFDDSFPVPFVIHDHHFRVGTSDWHMNAETLVIPGLDWIIIVCTQDDDFDGGLNSNKVQTGWFTILVGVTSLIISLCLAHCISRPLMRLVAFMEDVSLKLQHTALENSKVGSAPLSDNGASEAATSAELTQMCLQWNETMARLHTASPTPTNTSKPASPTNNSSAPPKKVTRQKRNASDSKPRDSKQGRKLNKNSESESENESVLRFQQNELEDDSATSGADTESVVATLKGTTASKNNTETVPGAWSRFVSKLSNALPRWVNEFPMRETQLLQFSFGSMLEALRKNHLQLQTANESKRRFIRYIFHEVRVPFNAIVLGVEQLREDLYTEPLRPVEEMQDVVNILNEQSKVVARILNDILALQKIEDGHLKLELAPFNILEMVCGTLRSFQPLFTEKKLNLITNLQSLEECLASHARKAFHKEEERRRTGTGEVSQLSSVLITPFDSPSTLAKNREVRHLHAQLQSIEREANAAKNGQEPTDPASAPPRGVTWERSSVPLQRARSDERADRDTSRRPSISMSSDSESGIGQAVYSYAHDVLGDRYRLRQVLANFLSNAVKYSHASGMIAVTVSCTPVESAAERAERMALEHAANKEAGVVRPKDISIDVGDDSAVSMAGQASTQYISTCGGGGFGFPWTPPTHVMIRVTVKDSGRGLSLAEQQRLFQPYLQLSSGHGATGLGLNISKSLVELHGGTIGVNSSGVNNTGCEFWFELPMEIVQSDHRSVTASPQVFHVSNPRGPATMRAWHTKPEPQRPASLPQTVAEGASFSVNSNSSQSSGGLIPAPGSGNAPSSGSLANLPGHKVSPSLFSLQSVQHTAAPLSVTVRQRMLERANTVKDSTFHVDGGLSTFSPLVGSSRRMLMRQGTHPHPERSPVTRDISPIMLPFTEGKTQATGSVSVASSVSPQSHSNKMALLHGLANDNGVSYGYGYSSRVGHVAEVGTAANISNKSSPAPPRAHSPPHPAPKVLVHSISPPSGSPTEAGVLSPAELEADQVQTPVGRGATKLMVPVTPLRDEPSSINSLLTPVGSSSDRSGGGARTPNPMVELNDMQPAAAVSAHASHHGTIAWAPMSMIQTKHSQPFAVASTNHLVRSGSLTNASQSSTANTISPQRGTFRSRSHYLETEMKSDSDTAAVLATFVSPSSQSTDSTEPEQPVVHLHLDSRTAATLAAVQGLNINNDSSAKRMSLTSQRSTSSRSTEVAPIDVSNAVTTRPGTSSSFISTPPHSLPSSVEPSPTLMAASTPSNPPAISPSSTGSASSTGSGVFKPRILVVEDSTPNRKLLVMLLRALKCDAVGVENGVLAVQEFAPSADVKWQGENICGKADLEAASSSGTSVVVNAKLHQQSALQARQRFKFAYESTTTTGPVPTGTLTVLSDGDASAIAIESRSRDTSPTDSLDSSVVHATIPVTCNYDLVFIDNNMPVMNGIEATRNIRALGLSLPVIAVTGNALDDDVQAFHASGINKLITKPIQRATLQATLKEYLPAFQIPVSAAQMKIKQMQ